jgi:hypothetical protein
LSVLGVHRASGKTTLLELIGRILFGDGFRVTDISEDLKDIDALITSEPYAVLDNADRKIKGLEDKLALSAK